MKSGIPAHAEDILLLPLGTGKGATSVYSGDPSSAFAIISGGKCRLLVDTGIGVVQQCIKHCGAVPDHIYISHNHTDHAGELPVLLIVERTAGRKLTVISAPGVQARLRNHRLDELYSTGKSADEIANWTTAPEGEETRVDDEFSLVTYRGRHSEMSYGFVLYRRGCALLGFSADSANDSGLYEKLAVAPTLVLDARSSSSPEHASFAEIALVQRALPQARVYVTGYGLPAERPPAGFSALETGVPIVLAAAD